MHLFTLWLFFSLEKPVFSYYFPNAKRLREIFCNKLVRIRAIRTLGEKGLYQN
ncbi:phosphoribosylamine--glycine ligase [Vibrio furnissii]|uniref:phosphoribosylamine--glycine ligase n=1 Tax=Vibrio furnissii TaxID=29494 RepID=UPI0018EEF894